MTNVKGNAYQSTNIRSSSKVVNSPSNIVGKLTNGETFTGEIVMSGTEKWIKLATVNENPATGDQYVASWVVNFEVAPDTTPTPTEDDPIVGANVIYASGKVVPLVPAP